MFFFGFYEGFRRKQAGAQNVTIPAYADTFQGMWRYLGLDGQMHSVNILQAVGLSIDPKMQADVLSKIPSYANVNNYDSGDSKAGAVLNTAGYRWNQNRLTSRNYYRRPRGLRAEPEPPLRGRSAATSRDRRPARPGFHQPDRPLAYTESPVKRFVGAWRWLVSPRFQNEMRAGANLAPVKFEVTDSAIPKLRYAGQTGTLPLTLNDPEINFLPQGRYTNTYQFNDNATLTLGHARPADGHELPADPRQPVQLRGDRSDHRLGIQFGGPGERPAHEQHVPGRHQLGEPVQREHDAGAPLRHHHGGQPDLPGAGSDFGVRRRHSEQPQLHAEQHRRLPAGQLAMEAELHRCVPA